MALYQFAAVLHPTDKEAEAGKKSKLIVDVQTVVANDEKGAILMAAKSIPDSYAEKLDQVEVVVRPF